LTVVPHHVQRRIGQEVDETSGNEYAPYNKAVSDQPGEDDECIGPPANTLARLIAKSFDLILRGSRAPTIAQQKNPPAIASFSPLSTSSTLRASKFGEKRAAMTLMGFRTFRWLDDQR
jgi:hypothetical protein